MVDLNLIKNYFPEQIRNNVLLGKSMMQEYIQLSILDYLSTTRYIRKLIFIGGSNLRLVMRIDRFSEDLDFDCKEMNKEEFLKMSDDAGGNKTFFLVQFCFQFIGSDKGNFCS